MGRHRATKSNLPRRLHLKNGGYYYIVQNVWHSLGRIEADAIEHANLLNLLAREARLVALASARKVCEDLRQEIFGRDEGRCVYCGATDRLGLDHVIPVTSGGASARFNVVTCCIDCNTSKGDSDPREFILRVIGAHREVMRRAIALLDKSDLIRQGVT
jgi:hypothetical protein